MNRPILLVAAIVAGCINAAGADDIAAGARAERPQLYERFPEAFADVADEPARPRILLVGDSISIGYTPPVRELLRGVANVHRIPDNGGPTTRGLAMLDEWLGDGRWDVIHFNFGLHDVARVNDGKTRTTPADYDKNLRAIVARLKKTGARLVCATTTPVPDAGDLHPPRRNSDVVVCNEIAHKVMAELGVPVDDLYTFALPRLPEIQLPANVHYTPAGYRALAEPVAASIRDQLAAPPAPPYH